MAHELPYDDPEALRRRLRIRYPIVADRLLGLGQLPNVRLQRAFSRPGEVTALDRLLSVVHWAWFMEPHLALLYVQARHPERFPRAARQLAATYDLGCARLLRRADGAAVVVGRAGLHRRADRARARRGRRGRSPRCAGSWSTPASSSGGEAWEPLYDSFNSNPWAAMPSLHFATSLMAAIHLAEAGRVPGALGWGYAGTLAFALVYLGEHYVTDLVAGAALVRRSSAAASRSPSRWSRRSTRLPAAPRADRRACAWRATLTQRACEDRARMSRIRCDRGGSRGRARSDADAPAAEPASRRRGRRRSRAVVLREPEADRPDGAHRLPRSSSASTSCCRRSLEDQRREREAADADADLDRGRASPSRSRCSPPTWRCSRASSASGSQLRWKDSYDITMAGLAATRLFSAGGAGGIVLTYWALRKAGMPRKETAARMVAFLVLLYAVYMLTLVINGILMRTGVFDVPAPPGLTIVPAAIAGGVILVFLLMALVPGDLERRFSSASQENCWGRTDAPPGDRAVDRRGRHPRGARLRPRAVAGRRSRCSARSASGPPRSASSGPRSRRSASRCRWPSSCRRSSSACSPT